MKSSIVNAIFLSAFLSNYTLVDSFATSSVASSTSSECYLSSCASACPTVITEPSPTTQNPNDRATRRMRSRTTTSNNDLLSQYSQLPPLGVSLHPRMGRASSSPMVVIERLHLIRTTQSPTTRVKNTIPNDDDGESFQNKLLLQTATVYHPVTETTTTTTNTTVPPPTSTTNTTTFSWKMALSTITLLSIGGTIASAIFLITTPPGQLLTTTPTIAAIQSLIVGFLPTTTTSSFFSTSNLAPTSTIHITLHQATTYIQTKILPVALPTLKKMAIMELWRKIWSITFRSLQRVYSFLFGGTYSDSVWRTYVPSFIRMGLKKVGIRAVQMKVEGFVWDLWNWSGASSGWEWWYNGDVGAGGEGEGDGLVLS